MLDRKEYNEVKIHNPDQSHLRLGPDAFTKAVEIKQSESALPELLKSIYKDSKPDYDYQPDKNGDSTFHKQLQQLISSIANWATENKLNDAELLDIENFYNHLFEAAKEQQPPIYFIDIKKNLEKILSLLHSKELPVLRKKSQLAELAKNLTMCGPGLYRHIEAIRQTLESPISFSHWLAELRTNLIYVFAEQHIAEHKIYEGNAIHAHNALLLHAAKKSWSPLTNITAINEHFLNLAKVTPAILDRFETEFNTQYNFRTIIDFICTSFSAELNRQRKQLVGMEKSETEWIPFDNKIIELERDLFKTLNFKIEESAFVFEEKAGQTVIKFSPKLFKKLFLKYCYENNFLVSSEFWKQENIFGNKDSLLIYPKDNMLRDLAWIKDESGSLGYFENLTDEEKQSYHAHSLSRYQISDRFHLLNERIDAKNLFTSTKAFQQFCQQLEKDNTLLVNAEFFKELLRTHSLQLLEGLASLRRQSVEQLLQAMDADYIFLTPQNPLHNSLMSLKDKAVEKGEQKTAEILADRYKLVTKRADEFKFNSKKILYSELVNRADHATEADQFIYEIYLRHYFPYLPISESASKTFKKAHEESKFDDWRLTKIFNLVKDGNLKTLARLSRNHLGLEIMKCDSNRRFLPGWAYTCDQQPVLDYFYSQLVNHLPEEIPLEQINNYALHQAAYCSQQEIIAGMMTLPGLKINTRQKGDWSVLHAAVTGGNLEVIQTLINHGANVDAKSSEGITPLLLAVRAGNLEVVKKLIENRANPNCEVPKNDRSPFCTAFDRGYIAIMKYLVEQGANVNVENGPLTNIRCDIDLVKFLVEHNADLNSEQGEIALLFSAKNNNLVMVKYLVEHGVNVNATIKEIEPQTALFMAISENNIDMVKYLIAKKADIHIKDLKEDVTPLSLAISNSGESLEIIKCLVDQKADFNPNDKDSAAALRAAIENKDLTFVKYFVEHNADVNACSPAPLLKDAIKSGSLEIVKYLIEQKADLTWKNSKCHTSRGEHYTHLHYAVDSKNWAIMKYILTILLNKLIEPRKTIAEHKNFIFNMLPNKNHNELMALTALKNALEKGMNSSEIFKLKMKHISAIKHNSEFWKYYEIAIDYADNEPMVKREYKDFKMK